MKDRILRLIREEQLTPAKFADIIGVQRSSISHYISGRNNPSLDFIQKILLKFKNINPDWLILGKGEMYKHLGNSQIVFEPPKTEIPDETNYSNIISKPKNVLEHTSDFIENKDIIADKQNNKVFEKQITIERIVIFYNNATFKEYYPS